jgi:hypothetical protein
LEHSNFDIRACFEFRAGDFEFLGPGARRFASFRVIGGSFPIGVPCGRINSRTAKSYASRHNVQNRLFFLTARI